MSNHLVYHCCDKHPGTQAGVGTCPLQLIINQDALRQRSQMATLRVNQNVTFKRPMLKKMSTPRSEGKGKWSMIKPIPAPGWKTFSSSWDVIQPSRTGSTVHVKLSSGCVGSAPKILPFHGLSQGTALLMSQMSPGCVVGKQWDRATGSSEMVFRRSR